jgi:transposase-like protein
MRHARSTTTVMTRITRKSDGRRIFPDAFKSQQIGRVLRGELTLAELSRQLGIARSLLQRWKKPHREETAEALWSASPAGGSGSVHDLQLLIGKQTVAMELLRAELEMYKKARTFRAGSLKHQL